MTRQTQRFIKGAVILSFAGLASKVISAFYNIPLAYYTGDQGVGYYQQVYPIYAFLTAAALVGLPNSVSKLIAEETAAGHYKRAHNTFKATFWLAVLFGAAVSLLLYFGGGFFIQVAHWDPGSLHVMRGLAFSPVFIGVAGAVRGYFQGMQVMHPTGISQIIENFIKVIVGIGLVVTLLGAGSSIPEAVGGAALGATVGFAVAAVYLVLAYGKVRKGLLERAAASGDSQARFLWLPAIGRIIAIAVPVTAASAAFSVMSMIDSLTLSSILMSQGAGHTAADGVEMLGQMRKAYSVINVPLVLSVSLIISLVPGISAAKARDDGEELASKIKEGIGLAIKLGTPASVGIVVLALPIMKLLYPAGYEGVAYLQVFGATLVFMVLGQSLSGILQGLSRYYVPIAALAWATGVKLVLNHLLIPTGLQGLGAALGSLGFYIVFVFVNYHYIRRNVDFHLEITQEFLKPLLAAGVMGVCSGLGYKAMVALTGSNALSTLAAIGLGALLYALVLFWSRGFSEDELSLLPKGRKLQKMVDSVHKKKE
ncbi:putative polysaccharide biosynthesis protein [Anaerotalea alkaliphila]|uniref:Polysaccharide biosynthesis protein n=1 Tax=Anaerotalea alkaliphila TaxID=2662126 RepID=A0A7X5KPJ3_9FIRM|nr:polysaccharide biosynthesis protein [Anaerotalea alkaliphila]NDL68207.1 polysaccharide biosynthesis protein [Anaerotalea alkaliphila]